MLSLSRRVGEVIVIAENIEVVVTEIKGGQVKLGFVAPPSIVILRKELKNGDKISRENKNKIIPIKVKQEKKWRVA
jgi:carbon storage regulator